MLTAAFVLVAVLSFITAAPLTVRPSHQSLQSLLSVSQIQGIDKIQNALSINPSPPATIQTPPNELTDATTSRRLIARDSTPYATDNDVQALIQKCKILDPIPPLCEFIIQEVDNDPDISSEELVAFIAYYFGVEGALEGNLGPVLPSPGTSTTRRQGLGDSDVDTLVQECKALDPTPQLCEVVLQEVTQDPDISTEELVAIILEHFGAAAAFDGNPGSVLTTRGYRSRKTDISTRSPQTLSGADFFAFIKSTFGIEVASLLGGLGLGNILNAATLGSRDKREEREAGKAFSIVRNRNLTYRIRAYENNARDTTEAPIQEGTSEVKYKREMNVATRDIDPAPFKPQIIEAVSAMSVGDVVELVDAIKEQFLPGLEITEHELLGARDISNVFSSPAKAPSDISSRGLMDGVGLSSIPDAGALTPRTQVGKALLASLENLLLAAEGKLEEELGSVSE